MAKLWLTGKKEIFMIKDFITPEERLMPMKYKKYDEFYMTATFLVIFFSIIILMTWGG